MQAWGRKEGELGVRAVGLVHGVVTVCGVLEERAEM